MNTTSLEKYEQNPTVRALIQLVPYVGASFDTAVATAVNNMREKRSRVFFDELAESPRQLTQDEIQSEDFLHAFFATYQSAMKAKQEDKIRLLASLLLGQARSQGTAAGSQLDEFDEFLAILEDLTVLEFRVLVLLQKHEESRSRDNIHIDVPKGRQRRLTRRRMMWPDFTKDMVHSLGVPKNEVESLFERLKRTGLYVSDIVGDADMRTGYLTPKYFRFNKSLAGRALPDLGSQKQS